MPTRPAPGPRPLLSTFNAVRMARDIFGFLSRVHRDYGDVASFRLGRRRIWLVSHPDAIRDILVTRADAFTKGPALRMAKITLGEGLLTSEGDFHKRQRRLMQPAFHAQRVTDYASTIVQFAARAADGWRPGQTLDVRDAMTHLTLEIVAKALFDADIAAEVDDIGRAMDVTVRMFDRSRTPWARVLNVLPLPSNFRFLRARDRVFATIDRMIADRRARPAETAAKRDFLSLLLRARDEQATDAAAQGMTDEQLRFEAMTLFSAGHETTANAMVWTWLLLSQNPVAERALHAELDAVLGDRDPTAEDVDRLPYARAVIAESMRIYPPAWILGREAARDYDVPGSAFTIRQGDVVLLPQYIVHQDARWWAEPAAFRPERWLGPDGGRPRYAYFPFGGGPRQCIGESFAWLEAILLLATVARRWRLVRTDTRPVRLHPTITLRPRDAMPMRIERRQARVEAAESASPEPVPMSS